MKDLNNLLLLQCRNIFYQFIYFLLPLLRLPSTNRCWSISQELHIELQTSNQRIFQLESLKMPVPWEVSHNRIVLFVQGSENWWRFRLWFRVVRRPSCPKHQNTFDTILKLQGFRISNLDYNPEHGGVIILIWIGCRSPRGHVRYHW